MSDNIIPFSGKDKLTPTVADVLTTAANESFDTIYVLGIKDGEEAGVYFATNNTDVGAANLALDLAKKHVLAQA